MKREGRQHGFVRTYPILPSPLSRQRRSLKSVDSALVAGLFTKVSTKPTNHSKYTGKCGQTQCNGCHTHPVCKSKDKAKGTMKLKSIGSDRGLMGYPVGSSAVDALAYLANDGSYDDSALDNYDYDYDNDTSYYNNEFGSERTSIVREEVIGVEDENECASYCDVGLLWGNGEGCGDDDQWYLVGHFQ